MWYKPLLPSEGAMQLLGWLIVIVLIGVILIYIVVDLIGRVVAFVESNLLTVAVVLLIILVIVLLSLKPE